MINRKQKGQRGELAVKKILEQRGYKVYRPPWSRYGAKDVLGVADLVYYDPKVGQLAFVQVKSDKGDKSKAIKKFNEVMPFIDDVFAEVWVKNELVWERNFLGKKREKIVK